MYKIPVLNSHNECFTQFVIYILHLVISKFWENRGALPDLALQLEELSYLAAKVQYCYLFNYFKATHHTVFLQSASYF